MKKLTLHRNIRGLAIIEFTIVSSILFLLLFLIIALGAYIFSLQMVNEATRKAARLATVCYVEDHDYISEKVIASTPLLSFSTQHIEVTYLNRTGGLVDKSYEDNFEQIRFVRARSVGYGIQLISNLSFLGNNGYISAPSFETILPVESLGVIRPKDESENGTEIRANCNS